MMLKNNQAKLEYFMRTQIKNAVYSWLYLVLSKSKIYEVS